MLLAFTDQEIPVFVNYFWSNLQNKNKTTEDHFNIVKQVFIALGLSNAEERMF